MTLAATPASDVPPPGLRKQMKNLKPHRLPQLDALRALAIFLVLGRHLDPLPSKSHPLILQIMVVWHRCGWIGVDLFFVLSGYLISGLLFREYESRGTVNVKRFLIRRGLKIYPAFFALVAFTSVFQLHSHTFKLSQALAEILFVQNYFHGQWPHTWSLAVEEHFYLAAALAVVILRPHRRDTGSKPPLDAPGTGVTFAIHDKSNPFHIVPIAAITLGITCLALRVITAIARPDSNYYTHMFPSHLRADSLMFGVLLCYLDQFHHARFRSTLSGFRVPIAIISAATIAPAFFLEPENSFMLTIGLTALYLGFGGMLMLALQSKSAAASQPIAWLGRIGFFSYSIYLWHIVWRHFVLGLKLPHFWELWSIYMLGSIVLGIVMSRLIEIPVLYLRDRFFPSDVSPITFDASPGSTQKSSTRSSEIPAQTE
jgi:peptidoglycan/LPS O-acetylase OafA/YrhL